MRQNPSLSGPLKATRRLSGGCAGRQGNARNACEGLNPHSTGMEGAPNPPIERTAIRRSSAAASGVRNMNMGATMKRRPTIFAIVVIVILCLGTRHGMACSCRMNPPPPQALDQAAAVFSGRVVAASFDENGRLYKPSIRVMSVWKGGVSERVELRTYWQCCLCGFALEVGQAYLVYAYEYKDQLWVSICSRTVLLEKAATDLSALGLPLRSYSSEEDSKSKRE
jgi:hypothetical protein